MTEPRLDYLDPLPGTDPRPTRPILQRLTGLPWPFLLVVGLPTLLAAIYYLLIASPRYVSEARFIVRAPAQTQPSALGVALQGVGLPGAQTDAFAVHEYIRSRDGLRDLATHYDVAAMLGRPGADILSRYPRPWDSRTFEGLHRGYLRFIIVGYDSTTGISTLRVEAFTPADAEGMAETLLQGGESLINRLNTRAATDAVTAAEQAQDEARTRLATAQQRLIAFRNRERFIDPARTAAEGGKLIGDLMATVASLKADRSQLAAEAPQSPRLPGIDSRIAAFERQIALERAKIAGDAGSLAPQVSAYEDLVQEREFAGQQLTEAAAALVLARQESRRQSLYLERVVNPSRPDEPVEPRRWMSLLTVLASALLIYGIGWLVWAGVREHGQG
ncbi:chain-length determining protein [Brevundimonas sp.]|uniref:chain-length determining protein n=1 Tax=Brevundimonas sp. TaxID=1871086 RepID=UPI00248A8318|nr:chain-length determining protein [Brevundimonas sp.]MDI1281655.1 chain-length determining protein [Brevundimonas sp.]